MTDTRITFEVDSDSEGVVRLSVAIGTDDPTPYHIDIGDEYVCFDEAGWAQVRAAVLAIEQHAQNWEPS